MGQIRRIKKITVGKTVVEGAGVRLRRMVGLGDPAEYDPFLLLDDFSSDTPSDYQKGFPWHPHRGIETITYVLKGEMTHQDSSGNSGTIGAGDVQWMTAGSGIYHEEMPEGDSSGVMNGFQLWTNLPAANKMSIPKYRGVTAADIPKVQKKNGTSVKVIAGFCDGIQGPVKDIVTDPGYYDVLIPAGKTYVHETPLRYTVLSYIYEGNGTVQDGGDRIGDKAISVGNHDLVLFSDGDRIVCTAGSVPLRLLILSGKPIGEPIAWYGPIVMNTKEELQTAYEELKSGTFVKNPE